MIFLSEYHASTYPRWAPGGQRVIVPLGVDDVFRRAETRSPPRPRAIFTSNPLRGLDWLLDIWTRRIRPAVPGAEFHLFTGTATYRNSRAAPIAAAAPILDRARQTDGVVLRDPVTHEELAGELAAARVMLYRGDPNETFCLSLAEAQAIGLPAVVMPMGCVPERVIDGTTGFIAEDEQAFAQAAIRLLTDDVLWSAQHRAALSCQRGRDWDAVAADFERFLVS
jgi:glycosyltransferase involved in cell wall biosynthesis